VGVLPGHGPGVVEDVLQRLLFNEQESAGQGGPVEYVFVPLPVVAGKPQGRGGRLFFGESQAADKKEEEKR
jgi:hypothetical protein